MLLSDLSFRDVYHKIIIIEKSDFSELSGLFPYDKKTNGVLVYGYIDHSAELTFELLSCVNIDKKGDFQILGGNDNVTFKFHSEDVKDCNVVMLSDTKKLQSLFHKKIDSINLNYQCSKQTQLTRDIKFLDACRNLQCPDNVRVAFFKNKMIPEFCWVRCENVSKNRIFGNLQTEPFQDFGIHQNDRVKFEIILQNGETICVAVLKE